MTQRQPTQQLWGVEGSPNRLTEVIGETFSRCGARAAETTMTSGLNQTPTSQTNNSTSHITKKLQQYFAYHKEIAT